MKTSKLTESWRAITAENKFGRMIVAGLLVTNVTTAFYVVSRDQIVVLPPPTWSDDVQIGRESANAEYKKSMGLFIASFLGNITPANIDFVKSNAGRYFAPNVFANIRDSIDAQATAIKAEGISISFTPRQITHEPVSDKVFVSGFTRTEGRSGQSESIQRTYEFKFEIRNYDPQVTAFNIYRGPPQLAK